MSWVPRFGKSMVLSQDRKGSESMDVVIRIYLQYLSVETTDFFVMLSVGLYSEM